MLQQTQHAPEAAELLGDIRPLLEQIGSPDGMAALAAGGIVSARQITTARDLRLFLDNYHAKILRPVELPAIQRAFNHAARNELRELIAYDKQLAAEPALQNFAAASRLVGHTQLQRLRPLRDQRLLKRYLAAVELNEANGWHTLVYGLTLAVYSLPLRQGLIAYAQQTTRGFIQAAARPLKLADAEADSVFDELSAGIPGAVETLLAQSVIG
jgi:urease accessory protein UreF